MWKRRRRVPFTVITAVLLLLSASVRARGVELMFADFNNQAPFNNFSGDDGTFANGRASIHATFDTGVFHGTGGASWRIDYSLASGFCGVWLSTLGKASATRYSLNFTNLYGPLRNSAGNPTRVEGVKVTEFSFRARGDGHGDFAHKVKVELKSPHAVLGSKVFEIPNRTNWVRCDFPVSALGDADLSQVKEVVFVLEDWRNDHRSGRLYLDDLSFTTDEAAYRPERWSDDARLDLVSQRAFAYFLTFVDDYGFALDRSTYSDMVSVGAIGFQLTAYCIGCERGWAKRAELERRVVTILQNLNDLPMGPQGGTACGGYRGFYYHFLAANTGRRKDDNVELSLYDTTLLLYGVLTCREYFHTNARIQLLSRQLFDRVDWNWFLDRSPGINSNRFYLAWKPGPTPAGTFLDHVDGQTDEALMLDVLALGSQTHPVSFDVYAARNRVWGRYPTGSPDRLMVSWKGSLFNYFFASCWLDFRSRGLDLHPESPCDLWQNDKLAILANRRFCLDHASEQAGGSDGHYATYGPNAWGLTACDNLAAPSSGLPGEYISFGALPNEENIRFGTEAFQAGTLAVYGAVSSINFVPNAALDALRHDFEIPGLWNPLFGFGDAFSLDPHYLGAPFDVHGNPTIRFADYLNGPWINHTLLGINVGPMLLAIENYRSQAIWKLTARNPEIQAGLERIFGAGSPAKVAISLTHSSPARVRLSWEPVAGANAYNVYTSPDFQSWRLRKGQIRGTSWTDSDIGHGAQRFYRVKGLSSRSDQSQRAGR